MAANQESSEKKANWADVVDDDDDEQDQEEDQQDQFLLQQDPSAVPYFSLTGFSTKGRLVEVSSGDTCVVMFIFGGLPTKVKARLRGVTAPKIGSHHAKEHEDGLVAREFLWNAGEDGRGLISIQFDRCDLRGQALVTLKDKVGRDINEEMIRRRLVYPFQQFRPNTRQPPPPARERDDPSYHRVAPPHSSSDRRRDRRD